MSVIPDIANGYVHSLWTVPEAGEGVIHIQGVKKGKVEVRKVPETDLGMLLCGYLLRAVTCLLTDEWTGTPCRADLPLLTAEVSLASS